MKKTLLFAAAFGAWPALAQSNIIEERNVVVLKGEPQAKVMADFKFISSEFTWDGKTVRNAPYSADAVTETTQTLADGNRISRKSASQVFRDSEGRTRREQTIDTVGPWAAAKSHKTIFINDSVAGVNWVLDPESKTARKISAKRPLIAEAGGSGVALAGPHIELRGEGQQLMFERRVEGPREGGPQDVKTEALGKQTIEGVQAEGTRTTMIIPAGQIGNDRPIEVVSERWYSPELQTVVMNRRFDPRTGESIYKLTNIRRNEPARYLFEAPVDYTVTEAGLFRTEVIKTKE